MNAVREAGRELDALVAEKRMGRCRWCWDNRSQWLKVPSPEGFEGSSHQVGDENEIDPLTKERVWYCLKHNKLAWTWNIPGYSTDIAAAWEVVEKLREDGWSFHVDDVGFNDATEGQWRVMFTEATTGNKHVFADGQTAPHAICLAALEAVDGEDVKVEQ